MSQSDLPPVIDPNLWYRTDEAQRILGAGEWAWRKLRRQGLQIVRLGNRRFVAGSEIVRLLEDRKRKETG